MKAKRWIILPIVITGVLIVCLICIGLFPTTKQKDNTGVRQEETQEKDDKTELGETPMLPADSTTDKSGNVTQSGETQDTTDSQEPDIKDDKSEDEDIKDGDETEKQPETELNPETTPDKRPGDSVELPYVPFD